MKQTRSGSLSTRCVCLPSLWALAPLRRRSLQWLHRPQWSLAALQLQLAMEGACRDNFAREAISLEGEVYKRLAQLHSRHQELPVGTPDTNLCVVRPGTRDKLLPVLCLPFVTGTPCSRCPRLLAVRVEVAFLSMAVCAMGWCRRVVQVAVFGL
jgi:hypothetical protein